MTINATVGFTIHAGTNAQFEAAFAQARDAFLADEGCLRYDLQRVRGSDVDYVLLEAYASEDAVEAHGANPALRTLGRALKGSLLSGPDVVVLDPAGEQVELASGSRLRS
ncbi:antibiotic biosynthesis monooxygenase [Aeromicrobium sp. Marseille-Q0843]|uniref:Antibiotic biosynthesis monooxygenase n=1 Tax=Aeromicrobium phoceense TaxID=2754045 RepID=A0A838XB42_9ACTN|nr:antibiotic biosynthesis monooxygenase [Aeromicrobium phoceense]MBA4607132.1 antibiotic biosynthesis monooxygenase [Aeromicrobium phoceense]